MPIRLETDESEDLGFPDVEAQWDRRGQNKPLFTRVMNSPRIYNIPLLNFVIISILVFFLLKLTFRYTGLYMRNSLVTIIITNLVLYGISETLAQSILSYDPTQPQLNFRVYEPVVEVSDNAFTTRRSDDTDSDDHDDEEGLNRFLDYIQQDDRTIRLPGAMSAYEVPDAAPMAPRSTSAPLTYFQFDRLAGFMCWGFIMGFAQCLWYKVLQIYAKDPKFIEVLRKVLTDQLCYSPVSLFCFFTYGTMVLESGTWDDTKAKLNKLYLSTLMINYSVWFPVQFVNFLVVPRSYQVPFSSSISVLWNCYLSMRNSKN